jgi:Flp pilus assembly protein TadG
MIFRFLKDRRGSVAPMFALAIIPVMGLVGAAVDYSRANSARTSLQAALDATALAMSKSAPTLTASQLQTQTVAYFNALFTNAMARNVTVTPTYTTTGGSQLTISATGIVDTAFMKIMGYSTLGIASSSTVKWGNSRLRVALALDNTGSMASDGKITALITATKNLLTQLKTAATTNGDVYVSVVPFVKDVNVGATNRSASWIDWTDWNANNGSCSDSRYSDTQSNCQSHGRTWTADNHNTWNGCVADRGNSNAPNPNNYDATAATPTTSIVATLYPAEQYAYCPAAAVLPLTYDWTALNNLVGSMTANGSTNQTIGLQLAWQSLVGGGPFPAPPALDPNYTYTQAIILLSDGLNTQDRWYGDGANVSTQVDARMTLACVNAKAAGMTVYTIQVNTSGDPTSTVMKNCASSSSNFFTVTSSGQINTVFNQIGTQLSKLRIAK